MKTERSWPGDTFDAIDIRTGGGKIIVKGTDDDEVRLEAEDSKNQRNSLTIGQSGRWLYLSPAASNGKLTMALHLPRKKTWLLELVTHQANFLAQNISAWLHLMFAKGDVTVENCRGALTVISGNADVNVKNFIETAVPERPLKPKELYSEKEVTSAKFPEWSKGDWANWGLDIGSKVLRKIFDTTESAGDKPGVSLKIAKGDLKIQNMKALECIIRSARGDINISDGRISSLDVNTLRGDIHLNSCVPTGEWNLRTNHGDIKFFSVLGVTARLNVTTRAGEIHSSIPLVKVTRQGPEAWRGGRMVGTIGAAADTKEKIPEVRLSTLRGDIHIGGGTAAPHYPIKSSIVKSPYPPKPPVPPKSSHNIRDSYQTPIEVLEALSQGRLGVKEAENLLDDLGYWTRST
jgi:hypothetical protein